MPLYQINFCFWLSCSFACSAVSACACSFGNPVLCQQLLIQHTSNLPVFVLHTGGFAQCCCFFISLGCLSVWGGIGVVLRWWWWGKLFMFLVPLVLVYFGVRSVSFTLSLYSVDRPCLKIQKTPKNIKGSCYFCITFKDNKFLGVYCGLVQPASTQCVLRSCRSCSVLVAWTLIPRSAVCSLSLQDRRVKLCADSWQSICLAGLLQGLTLSIV